MKLYETENNAVVVFAINMASPDQRRISRSSSRTSSASYTAVYPSSTSATPNSEEFEEVYQWKPYLYHLQNQAPKPKRIICEYHVPEKPPHYGREFHGAITRERADYLLTNDGEGSYLVRESLRAPGSYTLGLRCNHSTKNFRLFFDGKHYVADKRFDTLHDLVEDGLITMFVEANAADYINAMMAEPIYDKHNKFSTVRENERNMSMERQDHLDFDQNDGESDQRAPVISPSTDVEASTYEKAHNFKVHSFGGLNWCEYCGNFMWGLKNQGVKCTDCGLSTHKQCSKIMPKDCTPSMRLLKRIYGIDLTTLVKAQNTMRPVVIDKCIEELETRGLEPEGLYRIPGLQDDVDQVRQRFDMHGSLATLNKKDFPDINAISGALKLYLRQLPIPLVPFDLFGAFMDAVQNQDDNMRIDALHEAITQLHETKPAHFHTLKHLVAHLNRVTQLERQNKMNIENISIVFGPTIFRSPNPYGDLHMLEYEKKCIELMITHQTLLFDMSQSYV